MPSRILVGDKEMVVWWSMKAGVHAAAHQHPHEQMFVVMSGKMEFRLGTEKRTCGPEDLGVIPGGVEHEAWFPEDTRVIDIFAPFFTRGILLDVLALKGDRLPINYVITVDDIQQTLRRQGTKEPGEGDAVLFRTGHGKLWKKDNAEFNKGCPGPGLTAGRWLADRKIAAVGADTWPVEAVPGENPDLIFGRHAIWITVNGIYINENLDLEELGADKAYEFAWSFNPLPLKGATGSPGNSVAIA